MKERHKLEVGIEIIDNQHKILFELTKDLGNAMQSGTSKRVIDTLFSVLMSYTFTHFETEEEFFANDAEFLTHSYQHYQLLKELHNYRLDFCNNRQLSRNPSEFLNDWLINHIHDYDKQMLATAVMDTPGIDDIEQLEDFDLEEIDRRQHLRVHYDTMLDDDIIGHLYNANTMKKSTVSVIDLSSGGLKIYTRMVVSINDLLVVSCRIGKNFKLKEKVVVRYGEDGFYGTEFVAPSVDTVRFLTELCGAVHIKF